MVEHMATANDRKEDRQEFRRNLSNIAISTGSSAEGPPNPRLIAPKDRIPNDQGCAGTPSTLSRNLPKRASQADDLYHYFSRMRQPSRKLEHPIQYIGDKPSRAE